MNALTACLRSHVPPTQSFHGQGNTIRSRGPFSEITNNSCNGKYFMPDTRSASPEKQRKEDERPSTFLPESSKANFQLTKEESAKLQSLLEWQESSSKSVI